MQVQLTIIKFPEIKLKTRDAHKLRGYFGNLFKEHSTLLHNHLESGENKYQYPLVQYKVIKNVPYLVGINEGGKLLLQLFLKIKHIKIDNKEYPVNQKNIENKIFELKVADELMNFHFKSLWMGLNQENFKKYIQMEKQDRKKLLSKILIGNILSFYKAMNFFTDSKILLTAELRKKNTQFKNKTMLAFSGRFTTNALLPDFIGLGKSVSRGFGTIIKEI